MKTRRPNGVLYFVVYILIYPLLKVLFHLEVDRRNYDPPKGPFIVVSNHVSFMDFVIVMLALYPRRLNAVAAHKFFLYKPLDKLLPIMGVIPKKLFDPDIGSIKRIKTVLKRGGRILLFPEGRCSTDGAYVGIHKATGKLIKNLGVPVISCHIEGAYTCMPYWRKGIRLGRERLTIAGLFSQEDTKSLSVDEINSAIDSRLGGFDTSPPARPFRTFRSRKLVEGLHNIFYWCPKCNGEFTLETQGNTIRCSVCGNAAYMDHTARFTPTPGSIAPENVHAWYREQARYEMQFLYDDMEPIGEPVNVRMPSATAGGGMEQCGSGMLLLDAEGWHFDGELSGSPVSLLFPLYTVPAVPFDPVDNFQIYAQGRFYMFTPVDPQRVAKYAIVGECAYWRFVPHIQMTPSIDSGFTVQAP